MEQMINKKEPRFHGEVSENRHRNMSHIKGKDNRRKKKRKFHRTAKFLRTHER